MVFNALLKLSLVGMHSLIALIMGSSTKTDSKAVGQKKNMTKENSE
jgi:hypothetical protein